MQPELAQQKSFAFALSTIRLYKKLQARQEHILSTHLLSSGTAIGMNVEEAIGQDSAASIDRLAIALQGARETRYWLRLLKESKLADVDVTGELRQLEELIDLLKALTHPPLIPHPPEVHRIS